MLVLSFASQGILLFLFTYLQELRVLVGLWFVFELISNVTMIYSADRINKSLFTDIGKRISRFRVTIAVGGILGQLVISQIWDRIGVNESFYFSSVVLILLSLLIAFRSKKIWAQPCENKGC